MVHASAKPTLRLISCVAKVSTMLTMAAIAAMAGHKYLLPLRITAMTTTTAASMRPSMPSMRLHNAHVSDDSTGGAFCSYNAVMVISEVTLLKEPSQPLWV